MAGTVSHWTGPFPHSGESPCCVAPNGLPGFTAVGVRDVLTSIVGSIVRYKPKGLQEGGSADAEVRNLRVQHVRRAVSYQIWLYGRVKVSGSQSRERTESVTVQCMYVHIGGVGCGHEWAIREDHTEQPQRL